MTPERLPAAPYEAPPGLLAGRVILVTGAGQGLGRAVALECAAHGATLALLGRNQVVVLAALSLIGAMGSYVPPVAFTPVVTARVIGEPYLPISRRCLGPALAAVAAGIVVLVYANPIARFFGV
jgi:NAD(P)-dependent dehydrogenase (short-subunit alcohol dehydrogenase family)